MAQRSLSEFMQQKEQELAVAGFPTPSLDLRFLVEGLLGIALREMCKNSDRRLSENEILLLGKAVERRLQHEPVARILGEREFWSLAFGLNEATLEPRPDSETLVRVTLELLKFDDRAVRILDLGTGSGCLLLALLHECKRATGVGVDSELRAIGQARANAARHHLSHRSEFRLGNWFEGTSEQFDIVLSNPPYIPTRDLDGLMAEVRGFDPMRALDGGPDGLKAYRLIVQDLAAHLVPNGLAVFEVGVGQAGALKTLLEDKGFLNVTIHQDYSGIDRCVVARHAAGLRGA